MNSYQPSYIALYENGILEERIERAAQLSNHCTLCPHKCGVDRTRGEQGFCKSGMMPVIASYNAHFGEESVLVGRNGSGTIFFSRCNLHCIFCQNYDISQLGAGREITYEELASAMLGLQKQGCHNINFVTPSHMIYSILRALSIAVDKGLSIPLVYNSGGYDSVETLALLHGIIDIYMPDFKYSKADIGLELSGVPDYPEVALTAVTEMYNQVGDLQTDAMDIAYRGLLVRHLILPSDLAGTEKIIDEIANISTGIYLNLMSQYYPCYNARNNPYLRRRLSLYEYDDFVDYARSKGFQRL